jgi:sec-independent protein translocase protein TatC
MWYGSYGVSLNPVSTQENKRTLKGQCSLFSFLFLLGVSFGYYVLSPMTIAFLANYSISNMISNEFDITSYVSTITALVFGSGLLFQLPIVVFFLTKVGIVTPQFMRQYRKHAVIAILIIGAIITPSPDPLSQSLISIPLYILYEISIFISAIEVKRKAKRELEDARLDQS